MMAFGERIEETTNSHTEKNRSINTFAHRTGKEY